MAKKVISRLSFTHITELITINGETERHFHEVKTLQAQWIMRELNHPINSLYYARSGRSTNKLDDHMLEVGHAFCFEVKQKAF